jgi:hypothetical protein
VSRTPDFHRLAARQPALAAVVVCLAATLPYVSTVDDYFLRDDFGVVQLLAQKPASDFVRWFTTPWMDDIWGYTPDEIRPFPAASYQLTALGGVTSPVAHHVLNIAIHAANGLLVLATGIGVLGLGVRGASLAALAFVLLPAHPESVAWITGRVDSMPALFYLAAFLAYARWRQNGSIAWYAGALALFFVALFTKQTTITMVGTLVAYDVIVRRARSFEVLPYVPFVLMTAGYLALRYALFGQVAREDRLDATVLAGFAHTVERHLARVVLGDPDGTREALWGVAALIGAVWLISRRQRSRAPRPADVLLFAGPVWWMIGVAPAVVAGYESARHVYLAAVGWGLTLGVTDDVLRLSRQGVLWARACSVAAVCVLGIYTAQLARGVREYNRLAAVSQEAVRMVGVDVLRAPADALVIVDVPHRAWEWALPFAVRPPFTSVDLTSHAFIISPRALHCCSAQWFDDTRAALRAWANGPGRDSVTLLRWSETPASRGRRTSAEYRDLPGIARALLTIESPEVLNVTIERLLRELAPGPHAGALRY